MHHSGRGVKALKLEGGPGAPEEVKSTAPACDLPDSLARRGSFLRNVGAVGLVRVGGGGLLFLSQALLAAWMGPADFGAYSLAWAWVAVLATLAGLGLPGTGVRFIAKYEAERDATGLRGLLAFCRRSTMVAASLVTVLAMALVFAIPVDTHYRYALLLAFLGIPALAALNLDAGCARGFGWMTLSLLAEQIARPVLLMLIAGALVAWMPASRAEHFVLACTAAYLLAALAQRTVVNRRIGARLPRGESREQPRTWLAVSAAILLLNGSQVVRVNMDPLLIGLFLPPADVGIYTAALRVATLVSFILMISSVVAQPTISSLHAQGSREELTRFIASTTRGVFLASLLAGLALAAAGKLVLSLFGAGFVAGYPALLVLIAAHVLAAYLGPLTSVLIMTGRQRSAAFVHIACLPIQAGLSVLLIQRHGVLGAALAAGAGVVLTQLALHAMARRALREVDNQRNP